MKTKLLLALALLAIAGGPAAAEIKKHPTAKVEIDVPNGWKMGSPKNEPDIMTVMDPAGEVSFLFIVTDAKELANVVAELDKRLAKTVTDIKWSSAKPTADKLNGMDVLVNNGAGKASGKDVNISIVLVHTPADKVLMVVVFVDPAKYPAHKAEIQKLIGSIKPST